MKHLDDAAKIIRLNPKTTARYYIIYVGMKSTKIIIPKLHIYCMDCIIHLYTISIYDMLIILYYLME